MITKEEYLKAKEIVDQYEEQEYIDGTNEALYCVSCQALNEQECFCDEEEDDLDSFSHSNYEDDDIENMTGYNCTCGAYVVKDGRLFHFADCICGCE